MEEIRLTSWCGSFSHYSQGFLHSRWCRISSINSIITSCITYRPGVGTVVSRPGARHPVFCPGTYYPPFPVLGLASDGALMLKIWIMGKTWWKRSSQVVVCSNGISRPKKTPKWLLHDQTVWKTNVLFIVYEYYVFMIVSHVLLTESYIQFELFFLGQVYQGGIHNMP